MTYMLLLNCALKLVEEIIFYITCYVITQAMCDVLLIYTISRLHCLLLGSTTLTFVVVSQGEVITSDFITCNRYITVKIGVKFNLRL